MPPKCKRWKATQIEMAAHCVAFRYEVKKSAYLHFFCVCVCVF